MKALERVGSMPKPPEIFSGIMPLGRRLYTKNLYLRRLSISDAGAYLELFMKNLGYVRRWLYDFSPNCKLEHIKKAISISHLGAKSGTMLDLGIFHAETGRLIGHVGLSSVFYDIRMSALLSYWISEDMANKGYMTQSLSSVISFIFEEAYIHRIWAEVALNNPSSLHLLNKLGFRNEGTTKSNIFINGQWQDTAEFSILAEEYDSIADSWIQKNWLGCQ